MYRGSFALAKVEILFDSDSLWPEQLVKESVEIGCQNNSRAVAACTPHANGPLLFKAAKL